MRAAINFKNPIGNIEAKQFGRSIQFRIEFERIVDIAKENLLALRQQQYLVAYSLAKFICLMAQEFTKTRLSKSSSPLLCRQTPDGILKDLFFNPSVSGL